MYKIISLTGTKKSGKNTVADMLCSLYPSFKQASFAGKLKEACSYAFVMPSASFEDQDKKEVPFHLPQRITRSNLFTIFKQFGIETEKAEAYLDANADRIEDLVVNSPREILQQVGTNVLRDYDSNIHINTLLNSVNSDIIITDCRFENELDAIHSKFSDALTMYIAREDADNDARNSSHISEYGVLALKDKCKLVLDNNGTLEDLKLKLRTI